METWILLEEGASNSTKLSSDFQTHSLEWHVPAPPTMHTHSHTIMMRFKKMLECKSDIRKICTLDLGGILMI